jgi:type IV secretion system protein VirB10
VNQKNTHRPDDESNRATQGQLPKEQHTSGHDGLSDNAYSNQERRSHVPDLDAAAPHLTTSELRRMNRNALGLLAGIVLLLVVVASWLFHSSGSSDKPANQPNEETVTVSDAPNHGFAPRTSPPDPRPITLAPLPPPATPAAPPPIEVRPIPAGPHVPTLLERRIAAANSNGGGSQNPVDAAVQAGFSLGPAAGRGEGNPDMPSDGGPANPFANSAYPGKILPERSGASPLQHPDTLMLRGTFIRCVL